MTSVREVRYSEEVYEQDQDIAGQCQATAHRREVRQDTGQAAGQGPVLSPDQRIQPERAAGSGTSRRLSAWCLCCGVVVGRVGVVGFGGVWRWRCRLRRGVWCRGRPLPGCSSGLRPMMSAVSAPAAARSWAMPTRGEWVEMLAGSMPARRQTAQLGWLHIRVRRDHRRDLAVTADLARRDLQHDVPNHCKKGLRVWWIEHDGADVSLQCPRRRLKLGAKANTAGDQVCNWLG